MWAWRVQVPSEKVCGSIGSNNYILIEIVCVLFFNGLIHMDVIHNERDRERWP